MDSLDKDHELGTDKLKLFAIVNRKKIINVVIIKYKPIFVKDMCRLANISALILNRSLIINWSKGLLNQTGNGNDNT